MSIAQNTNPKISVRRLYDEKHFQAILEYNIANLSKWKKIYPNHETWIRRVIKELIRDSYERIAFGGFYHDETTIEDELCCSVIVKKNPYTPYLEIKNLVILNNNAESVELFKNQYHRLISHIKKFAEQRGYSKLAIELLNRNKEDRELIKFFFENDFTIAGRQANRYNESDEIVFLTSEVEQVYGFDPYDNFSASHWILSKYLKSDKPERIPNAVTVKYIESGDETDKQVEKDGPGTAYTFYSGNKFQGKIETKFNSKNCLLIIEEYFTVRNKVAEIYDVETNIDELSQLFIFDFTKENLTKKLDPLNRKIFNAQELEALLYKDKPNKLVRFGYEDLAGLLLVSNPDRFKFDEVASILNEERPFIYIKLGAIGQYLTPKMPLVFAYYPKNSNRTKLHIWGVGELAEPANLVNLEDLREQSNKRKKNKLTASKKITNTDGDLLFKHFRDISDPDDRNQVIDSVLWSKKDFDKHNAYNATQRIVYFYINNFINLNSEGSFIDVEDILDDSNYTDDIENVFDFYLKGTEVEKLNSVLSKSNKLITSSNRKKAKRQRVRKQSG